MRTKLKCKWLTVYKDTTGMKYDCERIYDRNDKEDIKDMIHFNNLNNCQKCLFYTEVQNEN